VRPSRRNGFWTVRTGISRRAYWGFALTGLITPLLMWAALAAWGGMDPTFLPSPMAVLAKTWTWATETGLLEDMGISVYRVVAGFVLSAVIALPLGLLVCRAPGANCHSLKREEGGSIGPRVQE
jgi:NitT/TauT family transport system permease protein